MRRSRFCSAGSSNVCSRAQYAESVHANSLKKTRAVDARGVCVTHTKRAGSETLLQMFRRCLEQETRGWRDQSMGIKENLLVVVEVTLMIDVNVETRVGG